MKDIRNIGRFLYAVVCLFFIIPVGIIGLVTGLFNDDFDGDC